MVQMTWTLMLADAGTRSEETSHCLHRHKLNSEHTHTHTDCKFCFIRNLVLISCIKIVSLKPNVTSC